MIAYKYITKCEDELPLRRYCVKRSMLSNRVHLHTVEQGPRIWQDHLASRDMLRSDSKLRVSHEALEVALATDLAQGKAAYTAAKGPLIQSALASRPGRGTAA